MSKPTIVITLGDPKGIGPEIAEKTLMVRHIKQSANFIVLGGGKGLPLKYLDEAVELIKNKDADALVTAPVNKEAINKQGIKFSGHTEYLAGLTGIDPKDVLMMFVARKLRVSLATRHIPLKDVPKGLNTDSIVATIRLTSEALRRYFAVASPRIAVCGLNPHSGEGGILGNEEKAVILPAIKRVRHLLGCSIIGPLPSEGVFYDAYRGRYDAIVSMYHDQGLTALKMVARDYAVNVTFGLPFIRTSPDHGTGYDIAGKGIANPGSMIEAIRLAIKFVKVEKKIRTEFSNR